MYVNGRPQKGTEVFEEFKVPQEMREGINILVAIYEEESYEGAAYVLFEKDGKLFEVHGSHCSCFGLEDQWNPEETDVTHIRYRLEHGNLGKLYEVDFSDEIRKVVDAIEDMNRFDLLGSYLVHPNEGIRNLAEKKAQKKRVAIV